MENLKLQLVAISEKIRESLEKREFEITDCGRQYGSYYFRIECNGVFIHFCCDDKGRCEYSSPVKINLARPDFVMVEPSSKTLDNITEKIKDKMTLFKKEKLAELKEQVASLEKEIKTKF